MRMWKFEGQGLLPIRRLGRVGAAVALIVLVAGSCSRLKITGPRPANKSPELILVDIPPGGELLGANPTVYWYGTDIDGRVVRYDYAVVTESVLTQFLRQHGCTDGTSNADKFINCARDSMPWVSIFVDSSTASLPTQEKIPLYASFDTLDCDSVEVRRFIPPDSVVFDTVPTNCVSDSVPQFMFVRAIDDQGAESVIKYRSFLRNNHWPETSISPSFNPYLPRFSIPNLTDTYTGIELRWTGTDRGDFLRDEPELQFRWRVYGPYDVGQERLEDRPTLDDTAAYSLPVWESKNADPRKGPWVRDTTAIVYDLWRLIDSINGPVDTTRSGYFLFVVQSKDDASVSDPTPAWTTFQAVYAKFERELLLVDETAYGITPGGYPSWDPNRRDFEGQRKDSAQAYMFRIARRIDARIDDSRLGKPHDPWDPTKDFWERMDQKVWCSTPRCSVLVPITELSRHRVVVYLDDDFVGPLTKDPDMRPSLAQYLDIGGSLWLMSRVGFLYGTDIGATAGPKFFDFLVDKNFFPSRYFGIAGMYYAGWYGRATGEQPVSNDEFIAANAISSTDPALNKPAGFPSRLQVDSVRVDRHWLPLRRFLTTDIVKGVPQVGYVVRWTDEARAPSTRPMYLFESWRPGFSPADQRLIAVRTVGPTLRVPKYKTAFMGCPLWFFEEAQANEYVDAMADWFFNRDIHEGP